MPRPALSAALLSAAVLACSHPAPPPAATASPAAAPTAAAAAPTGPVTITVVGTNDLHGHIAMLPLLGGYLANLRAVRAADGGVVLVDGGDMFQGTLESNLNEGASVVEAYNALGYDAAAIGNHEFDFGPVGERATPGPGDDPRGALKARAAEARFPFLGANVVEAASRRRPAWPNTHAATMLEVAGVKVGVVGVTTESTPHTTIATNFAGLAISPLAVTIAAEAAVLRERGAAVVVVAAHAGGSCRRFEAPTDLSSCKRGEEIVEVADDLPAGLIDVIVAGHTHAGMAHEVAGVAVIESFAKGLAFGRVDLTVEGGRVTRRVIHPPQDLCPTGAPRAEPDGACTPPPYEGRPVVPDAKVAALVERHRAAAAAVRDAPLGVEVVRRVERAHGVESALGNLFADLMLAARPRATVAVTNGGGLRADLPKGALTYGRLYEAMPFDNRFALVTMTGADLAALIAANLTRDSGILSIAGATAEARCDGGALAVELRRTDGTRIAPTDPVVLATSDFLAVGGDGMFGKLALAEGAVAIEEGETIRDALAAILRERGGTLHGDQLHDRARPRLRYPGERPVRCKAR